MAVFWDAIERIIFGLKLSAFMNFYVFFSLSVGRIYNTNQLSCFPLIFHTTKSPSKSLTSKNPKLWPTS